jgi:microcystin-dependent protein
VPLGTIIAMQVNATTKATMNAKGWALCDGTTISTQVANADIIGSTPDLKGRTLIGAGIYGSATFALGADNRYTYDGNIYNGEVRHTLNINEIPSHSHTVNSFTDWENGDDSSNSAQEVKGAGLKNTSSVGGGLSHNNMPPFYVVDYYIKVKNQTATTNTPPSYTYSRYTSSYGTCTVSC